MLPTEGAPSRVAVAEAQAAPAVPGVSVSTDEHEDQHDQLHGIASSFRDTFRTAEQLAASFVREAITRGIYRPGERLPQESIAAILGISRMPVRAGLRQLEDEGLITISPHRGATVTTLSPEEIAEIYELRAVLESFLLEVCIPKLTDEHLRRLRAIADSIEAQSSETDTLEQRLSFYETLYSVADRPRTLKMVMRLHGEVDRYLTGPRVVHDESGHLGLVEAIERRDARSAKRWLQRHLDEVSFGLQAAVSEPSALSEAAECPDVLHLELHEG